MELSTNHVYDMPSVEPVGSEHSAHRAALNEQKPVR
jgi:hypothetical protein